MPRPQRLALASVIAAVATATAAVLPIVAAHASSSRGYSLKVTPARGSDRSSITVMTPAACRAGTNIEGLLFGHGFPAAGQIVVPNSPTTAYTKQRNGGLEVPLALTMQDLVNLQPRPKPLTGTYRVVIHCRQNARLATLGSFTGALTFRSPHTYRAVAPAPSAMAAAVTNSRNGSAGGSPPTGETQASTTPGDGSAAAQAPASPVLGTVASQRAISGTHGGIKPLAWVLVAVGVLAAAAGTVRLIRVRPARQSRTT